MVDDFLIMGVDEVGRGCLAGPVVAAAVILDKPIQGLRDSKKLTKLKRQELDIQIRNNALAFGIGWTEIDDINKHGLTYSVTKAMKNAVKEIKINYHKTIIDGNYNYLPEQPNVELMIKADDKIMSVSAASIIAKVFRDNWMTKMSVKFPNYGFDKHVGYGTKYHLKQIDKYGPCDQHRMFYKPLLKFAN